MNTVMIIFIIKERFGVMGDLATTMRDPLFYLWHNFIDDIFREFKSTLPRYTVAALDFQVKA